MNRSETLFRAIGEVGDDLIARAEQPVRRRGAVVWLRWSALAACCVLVVGLAAAARLAVSNTKSDSAESINYAADTAAPETDLNENAKIAEQPAPEAAEAPAEPKSALTDEAASFAQTVVFNGVRYRAASSETLTPAPGEQLGVVEDSEDEALLGCAVYACPDTEPEEAVLILLDGEYLLFQSIEGE